MAYYISLWALLIVLSPIVLVGAIAASLMTSRRFIQARKERQRSRVRRDHEARAGGPSKL